MNACDIPTELDEERIAQRLANLPSRERLLVELGWNTGLRTSELLGLKIGDVWRGGAPVSVLRVSRARLKGGLGRRARSVRSRVIPLNEAAREAITAHLGERAAQGLAQAGLPLFFGRGVAALSRRQAYRLVRGIFLAAGMDPNRVWGGHSLRKRFCRRLYEKTHSVNLVRAAIGHACLGSTQIYLGLDQEAAAEAILALGSRNRTTASAARPTGAATAV